MKHDQEETTLLAITTPGIHVSVNGSDVETGAADLAALIVELDFVDERVATAVNGEFVRREARSSVRLTPGDRIEILSARQGG
ncbi:sulfur carrier protein ThiS [Candidatus Filomicrobium marinum]|uniref:sulfur carrier protein ThiS n=1 Tax=Candidatus Filomicrobium marinum TaxID=1608628 RepID=UPI003297CF2E